MTDPAELGPLDSLARAVSDVWPRRRFADVTTMVAVSGGADSVALLRALARLTSSDSATSAGSLGAAGPARAAGGRLVVLHFNHRLRGESSDADEQFVVDLADALGLESVVERGPVRSAERIAAMDEASLRGERYAFFDAAAHRRGARYVATAHTADDNVETVLHHLFRGTGPAGIAGMPLFRELGADAVLARPFLGVWRESIRDVLQQIGQSWREDASNLDARWQRNWIRGTLLPEIRNRYPAVDEAVSRLARQQTETLAWLQSSAAEWSARHVASSPGGPLRIDVRRSAAVQIPPRPVVIAALRQAWDDCRWPRGAMAERHWNAVAELVAAATQTDAPPPINLPGSLRARVADCGSVVVAAIGGD